MSFIRIARLALRWSYPWMIVQWVAVHYIWAYGIFRDYDSIKQLVPLVGIQTFVEDMGLNPQFVAGFMVFAASLALFGLAFESLLSFKWIKALMMPQYGLVFAAFMADSWVLIHGFDTNGRVVSPVVIQVLLLPLITAALFHTASILERFVLDKAHVSGTPTIIEYGGETYEAYRVR